MPVPKTDYVSEVWKDGIFGLLITVPSSTRNSLTFILANRTVFCTGGAGTICSGQVRALVHLGANACIVGRNVEKTESMAKDIATARQDAKVIGIGNVDVRNVESLQRAVERCVGELGGIDYVIAGAAGNFLAPISQLSPNAFKSVMDIDVLGSYNTLKATLPELLKSAANTKTDASPSPLGGRIIFVSATIHYTGAPLQTHVAVAKAGVDALSANVALEFGPRGITSNVIAPGGISGTEGLERLARKEDLQAAAKRIPLGRLGTVREIADATVWLFGEAAGYVTGTVMVVDGAAWRMPFTSPGAGFQYPDFLLSDDSISGVKGTKKAKI